MFQVIANNKKLLDVGIGFVQNFSSIFVSSVADLAPVHVGALLPALLLHDLAALLARHQPALLLGDVMAALGGDVAADLSRSNLPFFRLGNFFAFEETFL